MLILTANDVRKALPMSEVIEAMKRAYSSLSDGKAEVPLRTRLSIPSYEPSGRPFSARIGSLHRRSMRPLQRFGGL